MNDYIESILSAPLDSDDDLANLASFVADESTDDRWLNNSAQRLPIMSPITAGRNIPDDYHEWEITGFRDVRMIEPTDQMARFAVVPVEGPSLIEQGILDGDMLIMRITKEYVSGKLGVWQTPHGRTAKFAFEEFGDIVLHNENGWSQRWSGGDVKLLGLVVRVERDL